MDLEIGDFVCRKSYQCDILFRIKNIDDRKVLLEGVYIRIIADSDIADLVIAVKEHTREKKISQIMEERLKSKTIRKKGYLPGKILHLDGDCFYLQKCLSLYEACGVYAQGDYMDENKMHEKVGELLDKFQPDVLVITGHDNFNKQDKKNLDNYLNSISFIKTIKEARRIREKNGLIIIAGACGSNFEALIASGANFASSPERVNVHALDPSIIAIKAAYTPFNYVINFDDIIKHTYAKRDGLGGIETNGCLRMIV